MKLFYALVFFSALQLSPINAEKLNPRHRDLRLKRQDNAQHAPPNTPSPPPSSSPSTPSTSNPSATSVTGPGPHPSSQTTSSSSTTGSGLSTTTLSGISTTLSTTLATPTGPPPLDTGTSIPPLANITLGMPTQAALEVSSSYGPGATPPISGAPVLPTLRK